MFCKIYVLEISAKFMRKHLRRSLFFNKVAGFKATILFKKRIPTQAFSCEFWEIFKNVFFIEHLPPQGFSTSPHNTTKNWDQELSEVSVTLFITLCMGLQNGVNIGTSSLPEKIISAGLGLSVLNSSRRSIKGLTEAAPRRCSSKKVFLKISQYS